MKRVLSLSGALVVLGVLLACGAAACGSSAGDATTSGAKGAPTSSVPPSPSSSGTTTPVAPTPTSDGGSTSTLTIFTIVMENHDYAEIVGSSNAPYLNSLIEKYGLATNYMDSGTHPSLPNYLTMISGAPQYPGYVDLNPTNYPFPKDQPNLGTQLEAAKIPWRSYQEHMEAPCVLSSDGGVYAPKHDPFLYFKDMQAGSTSGLCAEHNVDYAQFPADLAAGTYRYMWITPDLVDDGHNPTNDPVTGLKDCDTWASTEIPKILASDVYKNGGVLFITWDEAENRSGAGSADKIPMIVVSERIKTTKYTSSTAYSHKSYLATVEDMLGLPRLATVTNEPSMASDFLK